MRFANTLLEEAEHDMSRMGLVLDTLKIQNVTDEVNYLASIGRIRSASLNMEQATAEAEARADASVQQATNWSKSEMAKTEADLQIADQETQKRIADAKSRREALIREERGAGRRASSRRPRPKSSARRRARCRRSGGSKPTWCSLRSPSSAPRRSRRAARPHPSSSAAAPKRRA